MATHDELIGEMPQLEKMTIQERLKHAKKRRSQQLKRYQQFEREIVRRTKKLNSQKSNDSTLGGPLSPGGERTYAIAFAPNVQLLEAAARGDVEEVEAFLKAGVDPNTGNEDGLTALHQSCIDNREDMLKVLIDNGADVNIKDREMWTPLHAASTCNHKNLAAQLITRGADLLAINSDGNMPYDICEDEETLDYIESQMAAQGITQDQIDDLREVAPNRMLDDMKAISVNGGDLEVRDEVSATPLHIAVAQGFEKVVEYLLECKVDIHARDEDGWQAIHAAACWAQAEIIQILVEHGANLDSRTNNNETPWMICEEDDIKSLIHQLKTENLKKDRNNLVRRSSSRKQQRSSIRRSSKRDKGDMRRLDAKGEAAFIQKSQEMPATNLDDVVLNGPTTENGQATGEEASNGPTSPTEEPTTPDHIMTDEPLPECRLSLLDGDEVLTIAGEQSPITTPEPPVQANGEATNNHTESGGVETKRPKSILKKSSSRVEVDTDPGGGGGGKKSKKEGVDRSLSLEQKQREKEEKEKEKQRLKSEKEKKKQLEKEEKQRRKEEAALRKQREKEERLKKDQSANPAKPEELNGSREVGADGDAVQQTMEGNGVEAEGDGQETLSALKRQRQQLNSPIHSNSGSPNLSAGSDERSTDSQGGRNNLPAAEPPVSGGLESGQPDKPEAAPLADKSKQGGGRFSSRFPFSLGFMQSYNLQNSSNYKMQKRDSVALTEPGDTGDVLPADTDNGTSVPVHDENGEPLKKFTAYSDSPRYGSSDETEACCKIM